MPLTLLIAGFFAMGFVGTCHLGARAEAAADRPDPLAVGAAGLVPLLAFAAALRLNHFYLAGPPGPADLAPVVAAALAFAAALRNPYAGAFATFLAMRIACGEYCRAVGWGLSGGAALPVAMTPVAAFTGLVALALWRALPGWLARGAFAAAVGTLGMTLAELAVSAPARLGRPTEPWLHLFFWALHFGLFVVTLRASARRDTRLGPNFFLISVGYLALRVGVLAGVPAVVAAPAAFLIPLLASYLLDQNKAEPADARGRRAPVAAPLLVVGALLATQVLAAADNRAGAPVGQLVCDVAPADLPRVATLRTGRFRDAPGLAPGARAVAWLSRLRPAVAPAPPGLVVDVTLTAPGAPAPPDLRGTPAVPLPAWIIEPPTPGGSPRRGAEVALRARFVNPAAGRAGGAIALRLGRRRRAYWAAGSGALDFVRGGPGWFTAGPAAAPDAPAEG